MSVPLEFASRRVWSGRDFGVGSAGASGTGSIDCDVVVIGSGAGGAPIATELAEGGLSVVVVEEGPLLDTQDYAGDFTDRIGKLMRDGGGTAILGKAPVQYFEGRCVGGSTVINGGMCWRTPDEILSRWQRESGLTGLTSESLEPLFERVEERISARRQDAGTTGRNNDAFKVGCDELGFQTVENVRNQVHCVGSNECVVGCPSGAKQSTLQSYFPRFFAAGGALVPNCRVRRILVDKGAARGVLADWTDEQGRAHPVQIRARIVVLSAGAIQSPLLLLSQKLANRSKQVGRNFTIHPNLKVAAFFDDPIHVQRGVHQAYQCSEFHEDGILMAPGGIPPAVLALIAPGIGREHAEFMRNHEHIATGGVLVDDHACGRVRLGPFGIPIVSYDITPQDQVKFARGASLLGQIYFAAGAREVYLPFHGQPVVRSVDELRKLERSPPRIQDTEYFTAHLMGTCRMHADPKRGVVSESGECHDVRGLFVCDASALAGTLGVNPQETIMALSTRSAFYVLEHQARWTR